MFTIVFLQATNQMLSRKRRVSNVAYRLCCLIYSQQELLPQDRQEYVRLRLEISHDWQEVAGLIDIRYCLRLVGKITTAFCPRFATEIRFNYIGSEILDSGQSDLLLMGEGGLTRLPLSGTLKYYRLRVIVFRLQTSSNLQLADK